MIVPVWGVLPRFEDRRIGVWWVEMPAGDLYRGSFPDELVIRAAGLRTAASARVVTVSGLTLAGRPAAYVWTGTALNVAYLGGTPDASA